MIRKATQEETAIIRGSLEAVQRGLFEAFLSGKVLGIVENAPQQTTEAAGPQGDGAAGPGSAGGQAGDGSAGGQQGGASLDRQAPRASAGGDGDAAPSDRGATRALAGQEKGASAGGRAGGDAASAAPGSGRPRAVVLVDGGVLAMPEALRQGATGGLQVGVLDEGFALDLQGAVVMARETRRQAVRVNEKASRLFLYGRDILGTSILEFDPSLKRGDHCIVTNPRREALGIGRVVGNFKAPRSAVEAVHDLGSYLRDE